MSKTPLYRSVVSGGLTAGSPPDVLWEFRALSDPAEARSWYESDYVPGDFAESRAHTAHWVHTLDAVGVPDATVTADTAFYSVFKDGTTRTYVAYNADDEPSTVSFSDGTDLTVDPGATAMTTRSFESLPELAEAFPRVEGTGAHGESDENDETGGRGKPGRGNRNRGKSDSKRHGE